MITDDALSDVMERSPQSGLGTVPVTGPSGVALVFVIAFSYAALAALAIELVILPHILPSLHAGHGLMVGHDSVEFQTLAEAMADRIRAQGWSAWKLSPADAGVIGIVAAAYTLTGVHEPYVLVPIYAALYAVCTTCVYRITLQLTGHMRGAWIAAAAFLLFPSATMIYADMHKDAWSCAGVLLLLGAIVDLQRRERPRLLALAAFLLTVTIAIALVWLVRPYLVKLMLGGITLGLVALIAANILARSSLRADLPRYIGFALLILTMAALSVRSTAPLMEAPIRKPSFIVTGPKPGDGAAAPQAHTALASGSPLVRRTVGAILSVREGVLTTPGGSIVDAEVRFTSVGALLLYLPRALQIGLLAPFPDMWFARGMTAGARMMRLVSGAEMSIAYVFLLGWFFLIPRLRRDRLGAVLFAVVTCLAVILVMTLAMPNVGTLYRMRYPLFMLLVGLGAAGWTMRLARYPFGKQQTPASAG